jgi:hypothetical protein
MLTKQQVVLPFIEDSVLKVIFVCCLYHADGMICRTCAEISQDKQVFVAPLHQQMALFAANAELRY